LRKIDFQEDYVQAIEQKQIEAENVTTERNRAEQAKWRAQSAIEEAKGEAQATIENARGQAEKVKLIAAAEAESIQLKGESLKQYPDVIQLEFVVSLSDPDGNVTWGILPQGSVMPFLNVPTE
jgi:regulator of protease activity HflC (stomatin/prohibitin superfamily)